MNGHADPDEGGDSRERRSGKPDIAVALSGGGVRAALFSLGGLLYLVDSGYNEQVVEVSSVSGGSITNAFVGHRSDFREARSTDFDAVAKELTRSLTERGLLSTARIAATVLASVSIVVATVWWLALGIELPWWTDALIVSGSLAVGGSLLFLRGTVLSRRLERLLFRNEAGEPTTMSALRSEVRHILCATDLNSNRPFFFTGDFGAIAGNLAWGFWKCGGLPLAHAVRASAAFPGAFTPKRLPLHAMEKSDTLGQSYRKAIRETAPEEIYLADGGIWNNLATDWDGERALFLREIGAESARTLPRQLHLLAIDASKRPEVRKRFRALSVPILAEVVGLLRFVSVLYWSTIESRRRPLGEQTSRALARVVDPVYESYIREGAAVLPVVIQIGHDHWAEPLPREASKPLQKLALLGKVEGAKVACAALEKRPPFDFEPKVLPDRSPVRILRRLATGPALGLIRLARRSRPDAANDQGKPTLSDLAAPVPTTLGRIARGDGMILLLHGYLSAWRATAAVLGERPMPPLDMKRFADIAGVRFCRSRWIYRDGRVVLQAEFTRDACGPFPGTGCLPDREEPAYSAEAGDPGALTDLGLVHYAHGRVEDAAGWLLKAANAGQPRNALALIRFWRGTGYRPGPSATDEERQQWARWQSVLETVTRLGAEGREGLVRLAGAPPDERSALLAKLPEELGAALQGVASPYLEAYAQDVEDANAPAAV